MQLNDEDVLRFLRVLCRDEETVSWAKEAERLGDTFALGAIPTQDDRVAIREFVLRLNRWAEEEAAKPQEFDPADYRPGTYRCDKMAGLAEVARAIVQHLAA